MEKKLVLILGRDLGSLKGQQIQRIRREFVGHEIEFRRIDPKTPKEYMNICEKLHPAEVVPSDEQLLVVHAMMAGIPQATYFDDQNFRVVPSKKVFELF